MKILILGRGQMALAYKNFFDSKDEVTSELANNVDIRELQQIKNAITEIKPDVVLNCAGKTNLDWCEQNRLECFQTNTLGADNVGLACQEAGIYFVHLSSGCVQESLSAEDAKKETDPAYPLSFYSWAKLWGDEMLTKRQIKYNLKILIIRGRQLISSEASPRNALTKMLTYTKFIDTANSMTIVEDMVEATWSLIQKNATGIYNVANEGIMTPYRLALLLKELVKPDLEVNKIPKSELNSMTLAERVDCVLDCSKLKAEGVILKDAETRLRELLPIFKENLKSAQSVLEATQKETEAKLNLVKS